MKKERIISKSSYYEQWLGEHMISTERNKNIIHHLSGIRDLLIDIQRYLKAEKLSAIELIDSLNSSGK